MSIDIDEHNPSLEHESFSNEVTTKTPSFFVSRWLGVGVGIFLCCVALIGYMLSAPSSYEYPRSFEVPEGASAKAIAASAAEEELVRSELALYLLLTAVYDPTTIFAGRYVFPEATSVFGVASRLASNTIDEELVRLTFPEGTRRQDMAQTAAAVLTEFDPATYLEITKNQEGYLFPETYFVPLSFTAEDVAQLQFAAFETVAAELNDEVSVSALSLNELVILASIIEREANDEISMKMVSGILQNRLAIGMPLQADATIEYVLDTPLGELPPGVLASELRERASPYNTYLNVGLPPTPIGNPGRMALLAALHPTPSDYLFYITGNDGVFYYAETLREHNANIDKYLR